MHFKIKTLSLLLLSLPLATIAADEKAGMSWHGGQFRLGYETLELPQGERMGLLGGSYLMDTGRYSYLGLGIYGALAGERGGFFTGGLDAGLRFPLTDSMNTEAGLFVGGGGGGSAPQGGGLMLRPYLGVSWELPQSTIGLQLSEVRFPNGNINSRQLGVTLSKPFESLFATGWSDSTLIDDVNFGSSNSRYSLIAQQYFPQSSSRNTKTTVTLLGFEAESALGNGRFATLATAGAGGGQSDGYAEVLGGLGWRHAFSPRVAGKFQLRLGAGGGGRVDTGGGLIGKVEAGVDWSPTPRTVVAMNLGRMNAPDGSFSASLVSVGMGYRFSEPSLHSTKTAIFTPRHWQITTSRDSYLLSGNKGRKVTSSESGSVELVTLQLDSMLGNNFLISGTASGAYDGGAGGYAVGLVGLGWQSTLPYIEHLTIRADVQAGVAGGGGLDVGGGGLLQSKLGLGWDLSDAVSLQLGWGRVVATQGTLDSELLSIGIAIRTTTLHGMAKGR